MEAVEVEENRGLREGLRYLRRSPATLAVLLVKAGVSLGSVDTVMIIYASQLFTIGKDSKHAAQHHVRSLWRRLQWPGRCCSNRFNDGQVHVMRRLIRFGFLFMSLGWLMMSGAGTLPLVALALTLRAMGSSVCWTYSSVIIQKSVPDRYLGRMFSLDMTNFQFVGAFQHSADRAADRFLRSGLGAPGRAVDGNHQSDAVDTLDAGGAAPGGACGQAGSRLICQRHPAGVSDRQQGDCTWPSRSDCVIEPILMCAPLQPTARSASQWSSVSPLRALTVTCQPASRAS